MKRKVSKVSHRVNPPCAKKADSTLKVRARARKAVMAWEDRGLDSLQQPPSVIPINTGTSHRPEYPTHQRTSEREQEGEREAMKLSAAGKAVAAEDQQGLHRTEIPPGRCFRGSEPLRFADLANTSSWVSLWCR